jgi:small GTP-binding protein
MSNKSRPSIQQYADKFNIMIVGDNGVGKSKLLTKYGLVDETALPSSKSVIPSDHGVKQYNKEFEYNNKLFLFKIWDILYKEKFEKSAKIFYKKADFIILVCAINNRNSFLNLNKYIEDVKINISYNFNNMAIISNKIDLIDENQVGLNEIRQKAEELEIECYETSSNTGEGIKDAFEKIFLKIISTVYQQPDEQFETDDKQQIKDKNDDSSCNSCIIF